MLGKLLSLASDQERIDLVAADYNSGADAFAGSSAHALLEALGVCPDEGDMTQYLYAQDFRLDDAWNEDLCADLAPYVSPERLAAIEAAYEQDIDELELTPREARVLQLQQDIKRCEDDFSHFGIRDWALEATDGTVLCFRGHVGDAGEVYDVLGPYELRNGYPEVDGVEQDSFSLKLELKGLLMSPPDSRK
jgi:hypothetical protein